MSDERSVLLPAELVHRIETLIAENGYRSFLDVIEQGVYALRDEHDPEFQRFLETEVLAALEESQREPSSVLTSEQADEAIEATYRELEREELRKAG